MKIFERCNGEKEIDHIDFDTLADWKEAPAEEVLISEVLNVDVIMEFLTYAVRTHQRYHSTAIFNVGK